MIPRQVLVLTHPDRDSTGHYFAAAARRANCPVRLDTEGNAPHVLDPEDVLLYVDPGPRHFPLGIDKVEALRVAYLIDVHQDLEARLEVAALFDLVFVAQRDYVGHFQRKGHANAQWLPLACDPRTHLVEGLDRDIDVAFVGKLGLAGTRRRSLLSSVLPKYKTNDYRKFYMPREMGRIYSRSKIVFNASINGDLNMRVFEAMAAGALLVTDRIENGMSELLVEGEHYVAYSDSVEAVSLIDHFLGNARERERIAGMGQALVLSRHTYDHRWAELASKARIQIGKPRPAEKAMSPAQATLAYSRIFDAKRDPVGMLRLARENGLSLALCIHLMKAMGKALNSRIPLTPNAIRARVRAR